MAGQQQSYQGAAPHAATRRSGRSHAARPVQKSSSHAAREGQVTPAAPPNAHRSVPPRAASSGAMQEI